jgi:hypothetical protein
VLLLLLITIINFIDRQTVSVLAPLIRASPTSPTHSMEESSPRFSSA